MLQHLRTSGITIPNLPLISDDGRIQELVEGSVSDDDEDRLGQPRQEALPSQESSFGDEAEPATAFPTPPSLPNTSPQDSACQAVLPTLGQTGTYTHSSLSHVNRHTLGPSPRSTTSTALEPASSASHNGWKEAEGPKLVPDESTTIESSMSLCEARVAGVYHDQGRVSSVHGLAGIMNPTWRERHKENISKLAWRGEAAIAESRARLISNAALQRQREGQITRQPRSTTDLDGVSGDLAKHLLDLHFNRTHYASIITYRPAIIDGLAHGGPWINKLLLNAIYYSSAIYSDRECLRSDPNDVQTVGDQFYARFKQLLADEIDVPSIPSAMALLLVSATLVSQGKSSAGWNLSGMAYRMITDLGCHMALGPDYQSEASSGHGRKLQRDMEQEMRKRLYWGAYVTDTTQAMYLGRSCMFASVTARVPLQLLDTFDEMELWQPYVDKYSTAASSGLSLFEPQPARTVSTFMALARLLQISARITDLYDIKTIKLNGDSVQDKGRSIEWELENWRATLPEHLHLEPDSTSVPPPHQSSHTPPATLSQSCFTEHSSSKDIFEGIRTMLQNAAAKKSAYVALS
ncbi:Nitrogen assimilation transcription factor nit-4 [Cyphellophora attinorum]|uniref:Nitrogen assimilation transcription factor nit-4 n=1 Tax=Cyphellophora attinorum TaxID=1664694 RepID=A0A0N0NIU9_9EURO|nr:Nitrogen assimilation transcription factor nit-4 [Phialophora attinorum]KPI35869.1 Nitrogen assimilation transcription factor nit-4 [Phialophora attinorum]